MTRLEDSLARKVTLVTACAGYGKTTLAAQWHRRLRERAVKCAWLTLNDSDGNAEQLLAQFSAALAEAGVDVDPAPVSIVSGPSATSSAPAFVTLLDRIAAERGQVMLIVDDHRRTRSGNIDRLLERVIAQMPNNMHVLISCRERPAVQLAALKAHEQVVTLEPRDLRLSTAEARLIFPAELCDRDVATLVERTEGWPVALQLARRWLSSEESGTKQIEQFNGSVVELAEYITEQVVIDLPDRLQRFLLQTCILERINGDLANEVCHWTDSWQALDELDRTCSLVLPLDDRSCWYRFHHTFREFLHARLKRHPEIDERELHLRASAWYRRSGDLLEAVNHARHAGDFGQAAALVDEGISWELIATHYAAFIENLLEGLDDDVSRFPRLQLYRAYKMSLDGHVQFAQQLYDRVREATDNFRIHGGTAATQLERDGTLVGLIVASARDGIASVSHTKLFKRLLDTTPDTDHHALEVIYGLYCGNAIRRGEFNDARQAAERAIRYLPLRKLPLGSVYLHFSLGMAAVFQGRLIDAESAYREGLRVATEHCPAERYLEAIANVLLAEALYLRNEFDAAWTLLQKGLLHLEALGWMDVYAAAYETGIAHVCARQDLDVALLFLAQGQEIAAARDMPRLRTIIDGLHLQTLIAFRDFKAADKLAKTLRSSWTAGAWKADSGLWRSHHVLGIALAEHALAQAKPWRAIEILNDLDACCTTLGNFYYRVDTLISRAIAHQLAGHLDRAFDDLRDALAIAAPQKMRRPFLDRKHPLSALLRSMQREESDHPGKSQVSVFARELRELMLSGAAVGNASSDQTSISEREFEVLVLLARGHSNKTIARMLSISEGTVKFHLRGIFTKLQVDKRQLAIQVAKQRAIID